MKNYDHSHIEKKWQKVWESKKPNRAITPSGGLKGTLLKRNKANGNKKFFGLIEFPYPSGDGLHVGHVRSNTAMDIISRKRRAEGYNVLYPIGWDAFGLPTEQYAIKTGIHPSIVTKKNTDTFRRQLKALGFSFDWDRELDTTDPKYYKWTQWIFLQMFKRGLAYQAETTVWWCEALGTVLANEEVIDGKSERGGFPCVRIPLSQWMLAITKYADRLDRDLDTVNYLEKIKIQQRNWIGKSEGAEIAFKVVSEKASKQNELTTVNVFTTRPDTLYGVTYIVLSPELFEKTRASSSLFSQTVANFNEVMEYIQSVKSMSDIDRSAENREKTGVQVKGITAIHPVTGEHIPVWVADYVLGDYGTGAVMAVPAHDERDAAFAATYELATKNVIEPLIIRTTGDDALRPELGFTERRAVVCIVKHWSEDKYLCSRWKKNDWKGFVIGGIETGERAEEAAPREIEEETGYTSAQYRASLGAIHSQFYHSVKNVNRFAHFEVAYLELLNDERIDTKQEEKDLHDVVWMSKDEVRNFLNREDMRIAWDMAVAHTAGTAYVYTGQGILAQSDKYNGESSETAKKLITTEAKGTWVEKFKLRDWVFSRQRYWGEPFPIIWVSKESYDRIKGLKKSLVHDVLPASPVTRIRNGQEEYAVPVPEKHLPVKLPNVASFAPAGDGKSALATATSWVNVEFNIKTGATRPAKIPKLAKQSKKLTDWVRGERETDTMPNWAGSSWYFLRYADVKNAKSLADKKILEYWTPVDWYNGGMEHTTLHLLYSRFWHKFLYDIGVAPTSEPYAKRTSHGLILGEGGVKMSKSLGNVVNPDDVVRVHGADTLRVYEMFMGPFDQHVAWSTDSIVGSRRFIERVWKCADKVNKDAKFVAKEIEPILHKTIKKVSDDIESMSFNTAISSMMIFITAVEKAESVGRQQYMSFLQLLAPFAPHVTEELWSVLKGKGSIHAATWPIADESKMISDTVTIVIQLNGKVRATLEAAAGISEDEARSKAFAHPEIAKRMSEAGVTEPKKVIYVPNKLINIVI